MNTSETTTNPETPVTTETPNPASGEPQKEAAKEAEKAKRPRIPYVKERLHAAFRFESTEKAGDLFASLISTAIEMVSDNWTKEARGLPKGELAASLLGDERFDAFFTMLVVGGHVNDLHGPNGGLVPREVTSLDGGKLVEVNDAQIARVKGRATFFLGISPRGFSIDALTLSLADKYETEGWNASIVNACLARLPDLIVKSGKVRRATADERKEKIGSIVAMYPLGFPGVSGDAQ